MKKWLLALPLLLLIGYLWPADNTDTRQLALSPRPVDNPFNVPPWDEPPPAPQTAQAATDKAAEPKPLPAVPLTDVMAPPIGQHQPQAPQPMDDPDAYLKRENDRHQALVASFQVAARAKVAQLEKLIEKGKAQGISQEQLAEGEAKLTALKAALAALDAGLPPPRVK
ncbi:hypothetical protein PVT67_06170 [Gallaecimonas kandeliae]|uniref:hypothetical protein n=1 Tax=Gallaecimonas kandeliae TaxID=3029055 RepID=UPI00264A0B91|nr:hypothetical protein [Gallaecimonas kandeliae]WKE66818.1 hypothetical protein PVT67_06170 [Gallaecimonas kandeliae]